MTMWNTLISGDAVDVLSRYPDESIHTVVTSPPYWTQRDYGNDDGLGNEDTLWEYRDNLTEVFDQCYRVLRDDGSVLLNLGDTYNNKECQRLPSVLIRQLCDVGEWICRQKLIWVKPHTKPDPARDRRSVTHEYVFHLTKGTDYWYDESVADGDHTSVIEAPTASSDGDHTAVFSEELVEELLEGVVSPKVCVDCGTPYERTYRNVPRPFADPERKQAKRARELYEDSSLTDDHIAAIRAVGISDVGKAVETEDGAGNNAEDVEQRARKAKAVLGGYYREFTMVERMPDGYQQQCDCDSHAVGGIVCDPFVGSGTTCAVAKREGYRYLGIDCNQTFIENAKDRVGAIT